MNKYLITLFLVAAAIGLFSETIVPAGPVQGNWTAAGSPYRIMGDISISNTEALDISAGTQVIFQGTYKMEVFGQLVCTGIETNNVFFTAADTLLGWQGIRFTDNGAGTIPPSSFTYTSFNYGKAQNGASVQDPLDYGGAVWANNAGTLTFDHCVFNRCMAAADGSAVNAVNLTDLVMHDCLIKNCEVEWFGGVCVRNGSLDMQNCDFFNNDSNVFGACLYLYECPAVNIVSCHFIDNVAGAVAGIYCLYSPLTITNSLFHGNHTVTGRGGAIGVTHGTATMTNCTFTGNSSPMDGGAVWLNILDTPAAFINSIFWDNLPDAVTNIETTFTLSYCSMQVSQGGATNIWGNPLFANAENHDYTLTPNSPCVDTGTPDVTGLNLPDVDLNGLPRIVDGDEDEVARIDMGCYELPTPISNGELSGQVTDIQSQPIAGATVTAGTTSAVTDIYGLYSMTVLEGTYSVSCTKTGYYAATQDNVVVDEGETTYCNFNMSIVSNSDQTDTPLVVILDSYPNPFLDNTVISFSTSKNIPARLDIFNTRGQKVKTLTDGNFAAGSYSFTWNGLDESSMPAGNGIYLCRLVYNGKILNKRLIKL